MHYATACSIIGALVSGLVTTKATFVSAVE